MLVYWTNCESYQNWRRPIHKSVRKISLIQIWNNKALCDNQIHLPRSIKPNHEVHDLYTNDNFVRLKFKHKKNN